jgi:hypothetical protein
MNYFKTAGGVLILIAVIGLETLFSAGIWYVISVGMTPALGPVGAPILAALVAPTIGIMALVLFVYSHRLKQMILEWEAENGDTFDEDHQVYFNKHSHTRIVLWMKWVVFLADSAGIFFRVLQEHIPWYGQGLLIFVFEMLAIAPWYIGTLVHIVSHRPAYAIRRDVAYMRDVVGAQNEMDALNASRRQPKANRPATAPRKEIAPAKRQQALPPPQTTVRIASPANAPTVPLADFTVATPAQASDNVASLNQNGHSPK